MSNLYAFLNPTPPKSKTIIVSERHKNEDGTTATVTIRPLLASEVQTLEKQHTRTKTVNGELVEVLDRERYNNALIVAAVVEPKLDAVETLAAFDEIDPLAMPKRLFPILGEYAKIQNAIMEVSGLDGKAKEVTDEVKN